MNQHLTQPMLSAGQAPTKCRAAAILVHGRGRSPEEMIALAGQFDLPDVAWIAPQAAEYSWYPFGFLEPIERNQPHFGAALEAYHARVTHLQQLGLPLERIVLIGFSQGACLTAEYASRHPARYGGVIMFTGGLAGPPGTNWPSGADFAGTPMLIGGAEHDSWVPLRRMHESAAYFRQAGAQVQTCFYPGDSHIVSPVEIEMARAILAAV